MTEYQHRCIGCGETVTTLDPPGTTCRCMRTQRDWLVANKQILAQRATNKWQSRTRIFRPETKNPDIVNE